MMFLKNYFQFLVKEILLNLFLKEEKGFYFFISMILILLSIFLYCNFLSFLFVYGFEMNFELFINMIKNKFISMFTMYYFKCFFFEYFYYLIVIIFKFLLLFNCFLYLSYMKSCF